MRTWNETPAGHLRAWLFRLGTAALIAGCQATAPERCHLALATDIPLRFAIGHLFAVPLLNDQPTNMILDTGAQSTTLTRDAADRLSLPLLPLRDYAEGVGGSTSIYGFIANSYQIGRLRGHHFNLTASDMSLSTPKITVDGLLGVDFLAAYDLDLDLPDHKAILYAALEGCSAPSTPLDGSLYLVPFIHVNHIDGRARVAVQIVGTTLTAVVDSGAPNTVIFRNAARRLGLEINQLTADRHYRTHGVGPRTQDMVRHVMAPITIGDLTVQNLPVGIIDQPSLPDTDMLLGLDFLTRVHAWFSFSSHTLILQYPPLASTHAQP